MVHHHFLQVNHRFSIVVLNHHRVVLILQLTYAHLEALRSRSWVLLNESTGGVLPGKKHGKGTAICRNVSPMMSVNSVKRGSCTSCTNKLSLVLIAPGSINRICDLQVCQRWGRGAEHFGTYKSPRSWSLLSCQVTGQRFQTSTIEFQSVFLIHAYDTA